MTYNEAKTAIDIKLLFSELRAFVVANPLQKKAAITKTEALSVIDNVVLAEATLIDPRFDVFNFIMAEMLNKVVDGDSVRTGNPTISLWLDNRATVLRDPAIGRAK